MLSIDRKLWRDLWHLRGQSLAIALVITSGIATFIMSLSTVDSLRSTQTRFYEESRFAEVFASLKRAPESVADRIRAIDGVDQVETRVVLSAPLDLEGYSDPVTGRLVAIPDRHESVLNRVWLREGRLPDAGRDDEVVISEAFATAHEFRPGATISATIAGRRKKLRVVGIALSAEYTYQIRPGDIIPDFERYGILWMARTPLGAAYDMDGAFNDVALSLRRGASEEDVIDRIDDLLDRWGGFGAYARADQLSHHFLSEEFRQLEGMATIFPTIFLSVAAFLLNVVLSRLVSTQRDQVAILKAFGYSNLAVGWHYTKLVIVIAVLGAAGGVVVGVWLGKGLSAMYMEFYRFPYLDYVLAPRHVVAAVLVSTLAAVAGAWIAVRTAALLPPAEAMRPEPPARYRVSIVERLGLRRWISQPTRMVIRQLERRPLKSLLSVIAVAFACAILMVGSFQADAIDFIVNVQFGIADREDLSVSFFEPTSRRALHSIRSIDGVGQGEVFRSAPARLRFEHRDYRVALVGVQHGGDLHRVIDTDLQPIELPEDGLVITEHLGRILGVRPGDEVTVEVLEGKRPVLQVPVVRFVRQFIGVGAYMRIDALNRLLGEGDTISGVFLAADSQRSASVYHQLDAMPRVAGTMVRQNAIDSFYATMAETMLVFTFINTILAGTIACGVIYNSARITLSERSRELASLRVLGFTRGEISYILLGELAILTLVAIPIGFVVGWLLCQLVVTGVENDLYRFPLILEPRTYAFAALVVLVATCVSGWFVRRQLDHLDLVAVLKTRE